MLQNRTAFLLREDLVLELQFLLCVVLLRFAIPPDCSGVAASKFLDAAATRVVLWLSSPHWLHKIQKGFLSRI